MKGKVLVIEDDPHWQNTLKRYLEQAEYYVDVVDNLKSAIERIKGELYHFITVDMQLDSRTIQPESLEGWNILQVVKKLGVEHRTPVMVVTGFESEYIDLKDLNKYKSLFLMGKGNFDKKQFIETVDRSVAMHDLRFHGDKRN